MVYELYDNAGTLVCEIIAPQSTELACEQYAERIGRQMLSDAFGTVELKED
jgi:hypothetical protein